MSVNVFVYVYCICLVFNLLYYLEHRFYCGSIYTQWFIWPVPGSVRFWNKWMNEWMVRNCNDIELKWIQTAMRKYDTECILILIIFTITAITVHYKQSEKQSISFNRMWRPIWLSTLCTWNATPQKGRFLIC
jgi:hypothetical protein